MLVNLLSNAGFVTFCIIMFAVGLIGLIYFYTKVKKCMKIISKNNKKNEKLCDNIQYYTAIMMLLYYLAITMLTIVISCCIDIHWLIY